MFEDKNSATRAFWVLIAGFIVSVVIIILNNLLNISFNTHFINYTSVLENATINISLNKKVNPDNFLVCFNDECKAPNSDKTNNMYYLVYSDANFKDTFSSDILQKIYIVQKDNSDILDSIENLYLYIGNRTFFYNKNDISDFEKGKSLIKLDNTDKTETYYTLKVKNDYQNNYKGVINHLCCIFLFLFYGWKNFIIPYLMLIGAIFIYYRANLNYKFNIKNFIIPLTIISTIVLRLNLITYYSFWADELYTKTVAIKSFLNCFSDPGNPPLFYLTEFFVTKIFGNSDFVMLLVPFVLGCLFIPAIYLLFTRINKNLAIFSAFFASINSILIYHSQEIRSSSLCALLIVLSIYSLFKYIEQTNTKNLIIYAVITALTINTHYYLAIFAFTNFLYGLFKLKSADKIKFTVINALSALTFLPYLFMIFKRATDSGFNGWIGNFSYLKFVYAIREFFSNKYIFIFVVGLILINIFLLIFKKYSENKNAKKLFFYVLYTLTAMLIAISIISVTIKPIFHKRLCLSIYSLLLILEILLIYYSTKIKYLILKLLFPVVLFCMFLSITHPMPVKLMCKFKDYIDYVNYDSQKYIAQNYEINAIITDYTDYLIYYPRILNKPIKWHIINGNSGMYISDFEKSDFTKSKKAVLYINSIGFEFKDGVAQKENAYIIRTNSITNAKVVYND